MGSGRFLIDTCILVDYSRGRLEAREVMSTLPSAPSVSVMTLAELFGGVREGRERAWLEDWVQAITVIPVDARVAQLGGIFWRDYRGSHGTGLVDALIAATAAIHGARLVTRNARHFAMLDDVLVPYQ